jgi:hypothetical protein
MNAWHRDKSDKSTSNVFEMCPAGVFFRLMPKISRQYIEMDLATRKQLNAAIKRRAKLLSDQTGVEVSSTFAAWLRDMAKQTINTFPEKEIPYY